MSHTIIHQYPKNFTPVLIERLKQSAADIPKKGVAYEMADSSCLYRTETGATCIVGGCVDADKYSPHMEMNTPDSPEVLSAVEDTLDIKLTVDDKWLLVFAQTAHDAAAEAMLDDPDKEAAVFAEHFIKNLRMPHYLTRDHDPIKYHLHVTDDVKRVLGKVARAFEIALLEK